MRTPLIVVLLTLFVAVGARAGENVTAGRPTHVRALTDSSRALIADAVRLSAVVAQLAQELEATDVIVYVTDGGPTVRSDPPASLRFHSQAGGLRYLVVQVERWLAPPWVRIAELAHELQHAVEVARAPEVVDAQSLARLYRRIGWEAERGHFESPAAVATGTRVLQQLMGLVR